MIKRYSVSQTTSVTQVSASNGSPVIGPHFLLQPGDVVSVDSSRVLQLPDLTLQISPNTICLIDTVIAQGPTPSTTGIFTDQAVPVGFFEEEDDTEG